MTEKFLLLVVGCLVCVSSACSDGGESDALCERLCRKAINLGCLETDGSPFGFDCEACSANSCVDERYDAMMCMDELYYSKCDEIEACSESELAWRNCEAARSE